VIKTPAVDGLRCDFDMRGASHPRACQSRRPEATRRSWMAYPSWRRACV
jgi:hypothetical protein